MPEDKDPYEVGYGKPPERTRFVKGKSGNPKGRPKKVKSAGLTPIEKLFDEKVGSVEVGGKTSPLSGRLAMLRGLVAAALKGDLKAGKAVLDERLNLTAEVASTSTVKASAAQVADREGVIVIPAPMDLDEWEAMALASQDALYRATMEGV